MRILDSPGNVNGEFVNYLNSQNPGTVIVAEWLNSVRSELENYIKDSGVVLNEDDSTQMIASTMEYIKRGVSLTTKQGKDNYITNGSFINPDISAWKADAGIVLTRSSENAIDGNSLLLSTIANNNGNAIWFDAKLPDYKKSSLFQLDFLCKKEPSIMYEFFDVEIIDIVNNNIIHTEKIILIGETSKISFAFEGPGFVDLRVLIKLNTTHATTFVFDEFVLGDISSAVIADNESTPIGVPLRVYSDVLPTGPWVFVDGSVKPQFEYIELFKIFGHTYATGPTDETNLQANGEFRLPDPVTTGLTVADSGEKFIMRYKRQQTSEVIEEHETTSKIGTIYTSTEEPNESGVNKNGDIYLDPSKKLKWVDYPDLIGERIDCRYLKDNRDGTFSVTKVSSLFPYEYLVSSVDRKYNMYVTGIKEMIESRLSEDIDQFIGMAFPYFGDINNIKPGMMPALGQALSKLDYPKLYDEWKGKFGETETHFYMPNMQGVGLRGKGQQIINERLKGSVLETGNIWEDELQDFKVKTIIGASSDDNHHGASYFQISDDHSYNKTYYGYPESRAGDFLRLNLETHGTDMIVDWVIYVGNGSRSASKDTNVDVRLVELENNRYYTKDYVEIYKNLDHNSQYLDIFLTNGEYKVYVTNGNTIKVVEFTFNKTLIPGIDSYTIPWTDGYNLTYLISTGQLNANNASYAVVKIDRLQEVFVRPTSPLSDGFERVYKAWDNVGNVVMSQLEGDGGIGKYDIVLGNTIIEGAGISASLRISNIMYNSDAGVTVLGNDAIARWDASIGSFVSLLTGYYIKEIWKFEGALRLERSLTNTHVEGTPNIYQHFLIPALEDIDFTPLMPVEPNEGDHLIICNKAPWSGKKIINVPDINSVSGTNQVELVYDGEDWHCLTPEKYIKVWEIDPEVGAISIPKDDWYDGDGMYKVYTFDHLSTKNTMLAFFNVVEGRRSYVTGYDATDNTIAIVDLDRILNITTLNYNIVDVFKLKH